MRIEDIHIGRRYLVRGTARSTIRVFNQLVIAKTDDKVMSRISWGGHIFIESPDVFISELPRPWWQFWRK